MKKLLILFSALCLCLNAFAQVVESTAEIESTPVSEQDEKGRKELFKKTYHENYGYDNNWFTGIGGGINIGWDGNEFVDRHESHQGAGLAAKFYLGKWINRYFGIAGGYQGITISDVFTDFGKDRYDYLHVDMTLRPHRNILPYIHTGYVSCEKAAVAVGVGLMLPIHLTDMIYIAPNVKYSLFNHNVFENGRNYGQALSITLGLYVNLDKAMKKSEKTLAPVAVPVEKIIRDTVYIRERTIERTVDTVYVNVVPEKGEIIATFSCNTLFDFDKYDLKMEAIGELERLVTWMNEHPSVNAELGGHTDAVGSDAYNFTLSEKRAQSVYNYLIIRGIDPSRLTYKAYGKSRPVATNETPEGRQLNRRVEVVVN